MRDFLSKKLFVFVVGTTLLCFGFISSSVWMGVAMTYVGVQGLVDLKTKKKEK